MQGNSEYNAEKCNAFQCDLSSQSVSDEVPENSVDLITLLFVLSAIHPDKFLFVLKNLHKASLKIYFTEATWV